MPNQEAGGLGIKGIERKGRVLVEAEATRVRMDCRSELGSAWLGLA